MKHLFFSVEILSASLLLNICIVYFYKKETFWYAFRANFYILAVIIAVEVKINPKCLNSARGLNLMSIWY